MTIATLHGTFPFKVKRFKGMVKGDSFLAQAGLGVGQGGYYSQGLRDYALEYCTKLSFGATAKLIQRSCGGTCLSDQHLWNWVQAEGEAISQQQQQTISAFESSQAKVGLAWVDIYAKEGEEIIYLSDDVCVKEQKSIRDKTLKTKKKRCNTRISLFSLAGQRYHTLVPGFGIANPVLVQAALWQHYPHKIAQLPIVAITDGATSIKNEIKTLFGEGCLHILDWYHLEKKIYETLSMMAYKADKPRYCQDLLQLLWKGKAVEALEYVQQIRPKNKESQAMLLTYLAKNQTSIIDYEKRKENGKPIGSGRGEKQNDRIVAQRQKYNGMAWSPKGSLAMALNTTSKMT